MNHIVIVGGGTSGWMAALALTTQMPEIKITVIDPAAIPPIGVGESVTGVVQAFVNYPPYRLNVADFYKETDATLKLGIWYKNWLGTGDEYLTPIDAPNRFFDQHYSSNMEDFFATITANGHSIGEMQTHGKLMRANKTDYFRRPDGSIAQNLSMASCHFDALKFAAWIKANCIKRDSIIHVDDVVERFEQDPETGKMLKVITEKGAEISGDFFLDCTGFRRLLLGKAYAPKWIDMSRFLKVDSAIPSPSPYREGQDIPVYTTSAAMSNGWMWQVPTRARLGKGYVYSSKYIDDESAIAEMRAAGVDPGDSPRIIRFEPGKYESQWEKNVCAIGLSGGFLEPLEATTIHMIYVQMRMLVELYLPFYSDEAAPALSRKYNAMMKMMYDDYVDFVSFHYLTGRDDTEFWRDYQKPESITEENKIRMEKWKYTYPVREDFAGVFTGRMLLTSGMNVWMPMLSGLGVARQSNAREYLKRSVFGDACRANMNKYFGVQKQIVTNAVGQKEALEHLTGVAFEIAGRS